MCVAVARAALAGPAAAQSEIQSRTTRDERPPRQSMSVNNEDLVADVTAKRYSRVLAQDWTFV